MLGGRVILQTITKKLIQRESKLVRKIVSKFRNQQIHFHTLSRSRAPSWYTRIIAQHFHSAARLYASAEVKTPNFPVYVTTGQAKSRPYVLSRCIIAQNFHTTALLQATEEVKAPNFPDSVTSGDAKLLKAEGDEVAMDEIVMEIETDKTALPVMAPGHGKITKFLVKNGEAVKAQQPLFQMEITGVAPAAKPAAAAPAPAAAAPAPAAPAAPAPAPAAAASKPAAVQVTKVAAPKGATLAAQKIADPSKTISGSRTEHPVPLNKMRKKIAERLKEAQNTCAMLTTFNECDMGKIMAFRKKHLASFTKEYGVKLSLMSPFIKAAANALMDQPVINGFIKGGDTIIYRDYVDISIAVATPKGLVVPVLRDVQAMNYPQIEIAMSALAAKAREGRITPADMQGGTFTISNGGVFGSLISMPIINLPQSAILGMHAIVQRPVAIDGKVKVRPMMYLALTYDHRLIDGREAVFFLKKVRAGVEDPTSIVAGI